MLFSTTEVLNKVIKQYENVNKVSVKIVRNNNDRTNAECKNCYGWIDAKCLLELEA